MAMRYPMSDLEYYYSAQYSEEVEGMNEEEGNWLPAYHINAFDFGKHPVVTSRYPRKIQRYRWGLIPYRTATLQDALELRQKTVLCRSEEMFEKPSFQELIKAGKRCLIPASGFFEHRWMDFKGKIKIPYHIILRGKPIFSLAGIYSKWTDPATSLDYFTYTVLTTRANALMETIHNSGKRMPVVLHTREAETAWLNPSLGKMDVLNLCEPITDSIMEAYPVSRIITSKEGNVPAALEPHYYPELHNPKLF
jgi:putative SOS response-associated peptidase YedK